MGKPHPVELRSRAVALVGQGHTHTATARRLCVSIKFAKDMVRLKSETGSLAPKPQGNPRRGKLTEMKDWVRQRIAARPDLTIDELTVERNHPPILSGTHKCPAAWLRSGLVRRDRRGVRSPAI